MIGLPASGFGLPALKILHCRGCWHCSIATEARSHGGLLFGASVVIPVTRAFPFLSYNAHVMIAKDLLEMLLCPACKQALEYRQNPESLKCTQCHRVYAVKDDIPIMLIDEATIEP